MYLNQMDSQNLNSKNDVIDFFDASYLNIYSDLLDVELNDQLKFLETNYLRNITNNTKILDLCCGNGRHLCQLNNKYLVDGVDINQYNISQAERNMPNNAMGKLYTSDIVAFIPLHKYDLIYCFENSIGYLPDNKTIDIFKNISDNLLSNNGKLVIHFTNRDFLVKNLSPRTWFGNKRTGYLLEKRTLDNLTGQINFEQVRILNDHEKHCSISLRLYTLQEISCLLERADLKITKVYGDFVGNSYTSRSPAMIIEIQHLRR